MAQDFHRRDDDHLAAVVPPPATPAFFNARGMGLVHYDRAGDAVAFGSDVARRYLLGQRDSMRCRRHASSGAKRTWNSPVVFGKSGRSMLEFSYRRTPEHKVAC